MPNQPLNPDAAWEAVLSVSDLFHIDTENAEVITREAISAYLAFAQPVVNSVEELDNLPVESVLLDADNCVMQILHNGEQYLNGDPYREYCMVGDTRGYESVEVALPARVLYRPVVES